jgi:murein DD-endopeptidase MepM/ murein hydrolase activator NlpD
MRKFAFIMFLLSTLLSCATTKQLCKDGGVYHIVRRGETLYSIGKAYGVSWYELKKINRIKDVRKIKVGTKIFIPGAKKVLKVERRSKNVERLRIIWPLKGEILSPFGKREGGDMHKGIDISASKGTEIVAVASGEVVFSGWMRGYGNVVIIEHVDEIYTVYAHNLKNLVRNGEKVYKNQVIATVGMSGKATRPHLHFEIRIAEKAVDPLLYLPRSKENF